MDKGYTYEYKKDTNSVEIYNLKDFDPVHTFMCGQCFRWDAEEDGSFTGVVKGKAVNIRLKDSTLVISNCSEEDFLNVWLKYLDLDTDYGEIKKTFAKDKHLNRAAEFGGGIRILNQEPFECLISFVISTQNSIPRIKKIIGKMCRLFGERIVLGDKEYYSFPSVSSLANLTEADLAPLNAGYRAPYILDAAKKVASGEIDLERLFSVPTDEARKELMKIKGVGPKVADCTLLFSLHKGDVFPVDVWMGKIMRSLYMDEGATVKEICRFGAEKFGKHSGIAQQYLFYYAREKGID